MPAAKHRQQLAVDLLERGELTVTAAGGSMAPTLPVGARVRVVAATVVTAGDVALLRVTAAPGFLLHRIVARLPGGYLVHRGDAPGASAGLARARDVLGRADLPRRSVGTRERMRGILAALRARVIR